MIPLLRWAEFTGALRRIMGHELGIEQVKVAST